MFSVHPVIVGISFVCAVIFCGFSIGPKKLSESLLYALPIMVVVALVNPLFSHRGVTVLFYINDDPVTKEALLYGANVSVQLAAVFYWFRCYGAVMTSDKFVYLFGRFLPKFALLLSMTLGFFPRLKRKYREIDDAQKALGMYSHKGFFSKVRHRMNVLNVLISCALESSVETADSMRARGYGLKGRTVYSVFRFTFRDALLCAATVLVTAFFCFSAYKGATDFGFYPAVSPIRLSPLCTALYSALFAQMLICSFIEIRGNVLWRCLKSRI